MSVVDRALIGKPNRRIDFTDAPSLASPLLSRTLLFAASSEDAFCPMQVSLGGPFRGLRGLGGRRCLYIDIFYSYMNIACYAFRLLRPSIIKRGFNKY
jgi:hypothetical protein